VPATARRLGQRRGVVLPPDRSDVGAICAAGLTAATRGPELLPPSKACGGPCATAVT